MNLRLSWTKMNTWDKYSREDAIAMIRGIELPSSSQADEGKRIHEYIEVSRLNPLNLDDKPKHFEYKKTIRINNWLKFSFVVDLLAGNCIVDYKTGDTKADPMQLYVYAYCLDLIGKPIDEGILAYIKCNSDNIIEVKKIDRFDIGAEELEEAKLYIDDISWQIRNYFEDNPELQIPMGGTGVYSSFAR